MKVERNERGKMKDNRKQKVSYSKIHIVVINSLEGEHVYKLEITKLELLSQR